jgi:hypothetical protein
MKSAICSSCFKRSAQLGAKFSLQLAFLLEGSQHTLDEGETRNSIGGKHAHFFSTENAFRACLPKDQIFQFLSEHAKN